MGHAVWREKNSMLAQEGASAAKQASATLFACDSASAMQQWLNRHCQSKANAVAEQCANALALAVRAVSGNATRNNQ